MERLTRNIILIGMLLTTVCTWSAEPYYSFSFDASSDSPLDGWTCRSAGKIPKKTSQWSEYFPEGCEAYQVLKFPGVEDAAYSNSNTEEGGKVDEWLISPKIEIPSGKKSFILRFEEIAIGSIRPGNYDVYLSLGGTNADDFSTLLYSGRPKGTTSAAVANTVCVPVTGYAGKDIHIAFVNRSSGTGLLGFTGIVLEDYNIDITSQIPEFMSQEGEVKLRLDVSVMTPSECNGFTARFLIDGDAAREYRTEQDLSNGFKARIDFTPDLHVAFGEKKSYRIELSFADASLSPFIYNGSVTCAKGFPGVCVMEEATGSWCPACVRGAASLERYTVDFPGQFFGIAVHEKDPMTVEPYSTDLKNESKISSFPSAWFNRQIRDDPQKLGYVKDFVSKRIPSSVSIDSVNIVEQDGKKKMIVFYSPQLCYDTEVADLRAVAVITEDHCKGTSPGWGQSNGYSSSTPESVGGPDWWPYFKFFSEKDSFILPDEMEFNHVAWGIFNDYDGSGSNIARSWKAYTPQQYSITFDIPMQEESDGGGVQNIDNTAVTVILIDGATGHVAGADRMEANRYNGKHPSGISSICLSNFRVMRNGNMIYVTGDREARVDAFDMNGIYLGGVMHKKDDPCTLRISETNKTVIVRIVSGNDTAIFKLL